MKTQVISDLLGNLTLVNYIVAFIFVFLALVVKWIWKTVDSIKNDPHTPKTFSWKYWLEDNFLPKVLTILANIISVFIILRFSVEIVNVNFSYFFAVLVGFGLDYYINELKKLQHKPESTDNK